jgi:hypothetical protein
MPGFNIGGGGGGGEDPSNVTELRRKHRWTFQLLGNQILSPAVLFLQKASRPNFKLEEAIMHHDQEQSYYAGKQSWEPIAITFYDAENAPDVTDQVFKWVTKVIPSGLDDQGGRVTVSLPATYKQPSNLQMIDGTGAPLETWSLKGSWPASTNWGELDYTSSEIQLIEISVRFDRATYTAASSA